MISTTISIRVVPRASRNEVCGKFNDAIKVRLQSPPVDNKANKALVAFLAKKLGIPKRNISILTGDMSRNKNVTIEGMAKQDVLKKLL